MPRFESEILYEAIHRPTLETFAESVGWTVEGYGHNHVFLKGHDERSEDDMLEDLQYVIEFFNGEGAPALNWRIVRVIFDSVTGHDEITTTRDN